MNYSLRVLQVKRTAPSPFLRTFFMPKPAWSVYTLNNTENSTCTGQQIWAMHMCKPREIRAHSWESTLQHSTRMMHLGQGLRCDFGSEPGPSSPEFKCACTENSAGFRNLQSVGRMHGRGGLFTRALLHTLVAHHVAHDISTCVV